MKSRIIMLVVTMLIVGVAGMNAQKIKITELQSPNSPLISFRIVLRVGSINDPKGKEGLNALTAGLIAQGGTKEWTYSQVTDKFYPWASGIDYQPETEITTFIGDIHVDNLDGYYKVFSDLLLNPRFDPEDFKRVKDDQLNYIKNSLRATSDEALGKQALAVSIFHGHPYGKIEAGTVQGITAITLNDVKEYYKKMYTQGNVWVGIAGGYPASLIAAIKKDFAKLPSGSFKQVALPRPEKINDIEALIVEKPTRAYAVSMGYPISITRKDKDFYPLMLANSYFGEHRTFNGVLMNRLRGDRGLNYGDYSYVEKFVGGLGGPFPDLNTPLRQQFFSIWLRPVQPENTHFAIRNAMYELKNLVSKGLSKEDFETTRKFVINYSKLWASTINRRLGYKMDSEFYGSEYYIDRIEKELSKLTVDDVNKVVKKYLNDSNLKLAVVVDEGKGKDFLTALTDNAPSPIKYSSNPAQKILDEDKAITTFPLKINKKNSKVVIASELFEK